MQLVFALSLISLSLWEVLCLWEDEGGDDEGVPKGDELDGLTSFPFSSSPFLSATSKPPLPASSPPEESSTMVSITILVISGQRKTFRFEGATTILRLK